MPFFHQYVMSERIYKIRQLFHFVIASYLMWYSFLQTSVNIFLLLFKFQLHLQTFFFSFFAITMSCHAFFFLFQVCRSMSKHSVTVWLEIHGVDSFIVICTLVLRLSHAFLPMLKWQRSHLKKKENLLQMWRKT